MKSKLFMYVLQSFVVEARFEAGLNKIEWASRPLIFIGFLHGLGVEAKLQWASTPLNFLWFL